MSRNATIEIYDARAGEYAGLTSGLGDTRQLEAFAAALPAGASVLDLGCGPGFYAAWLARHGFDVEARDGSGEMVDLARAQVGVRACQALFENLDDAGVFVGIWANFSLLHVAKADFPGILRRVHRAGKPGMVFHIGMKLGSGEGPDGIGRFYAYYSEDELEAHLKDAGLGVSARWHGRSKGLSGEMAEHVMMLCHG